jgi:chromosome segregation ATPase
MSDATISTNLLHTHHLSRQIGHVNKQVKSLQAFEVSIGGRLKELELSAEASNIRDVQQTVAALEKRVQQTSDHGIQTEAKMTFLQQSLQEMLNHNKSLQRRLEQLQAAYDAVIDAVERIQPGQEETDGHGLTSKLDSVQDAQNHNREQMDAVHHRMKFLEEENVQVKRTVAELTAKLQASNCNDINAPAVVKQAPEMTFSSPISLRSSPLQYKQNYRYVTSCALMT